MKETLDVSNSFIGQMDALKKASQNPQKRSDTRMNIFPLQSPIKSYAQTIDQERRSLDITENQKISKEIEKFLRIIFKCKDPKQQMLFVRGAQYILDDWCSDHLFQIRNEYCAALKHLNALFDSGFRKHEETGSVGPTLIEKGGKKTKQCINLYNLLLDLSVGIESIFREVGQMYELMIKNELCVEKLPLLAASLLLGGLALEIMDGNALSCSIHWIESVLVEVEELFKVQMNIGRRDPELFVVTILRTQTTDKSTLLNTMFGVQFPVNAGGCTKGAFLQLVPLKIEECAYDAIILVDTEGLETPEYEKFKTHNEIATFVLGISDLVLINFGGESHSHLLTFSGVRQTFLRANQENFLPSVMLVHQHCYPSTKFKHDSCKENFKKIMNKGFQHQASSFQKEFQIIGYNYLVNTSIDNIFLCLPEIFEGKPPMASTSHDYSLACWKLRCSVLQKMNSTYQKNGKAKTLKKFSEKVASVWNGKVIKRNACV